MIRTSLAVMLCILTVACGRADEPAQGNAPADAEAIADKEKPALTVQTLAAGLRKGSRSTLKPESSGAMNTVHVAAMKSTR